jgi:hypothetical protein
MGSGSVTIWYGIFLLVDGRIRVRTNNYGSGPRRPKNIGIGNNCFLILPLTNPGNGSSIQGFGSVFICYGSGSSILG